MSPGRSTSRSCSRGPARSSRCATLAECRSGTLSQSLERVKHEVSAWCGAAGPDDDISMIGVQITG
jgi:hypothetical protein